MTECNDVRSYAVVQCAKASVFSGTVYTVIHNKGIFLRHFGLNLAATGYKHTIKR